MFSPSPSYASSVQVCGVGGEGVAGRGTPVQYEASPHHSCTGEGKSSHILAVPGRSMAGEEEGEERKEGTEIRKGASKRGSPSHPGTGDLWFVSSPGDAAVPTLLPIQ